MRRNTRGVSVTLSYVLTLGITAILISGLLLGAGSLFETQQRQSAQTQLQDVGGSFAQQINAVDRLADSGRADASVAVSLPSQVSGGDYSIDVQPTDIDDGGDQEAALYLSGSGASVSVPLGNETWVETGGVATEDFEMVLCTGVSGTPDGQEIRFGGGCP